MEDTVADLCSYLILVLVTIEVLRTAKPKAVLAIASQPDFARPLGYEIIYLCEFYASEREQPSSLSQDASYYVWPLPMNLSCSSDAQGSLS